MKNPVRIDRASRNDPVLWLAIAGITGLWAVGYCMNPADSGATIFGIHPWACPLRSLTGIRCPFCGLTTGCSWIAHGNLAAAWRSNILSPWLMLGSLIALAYLAAVRAGAGHKIVLEVNPAHARLARILVLACFAVSWLFNLARS